MNYIEQIKGFNPKIKLEESNKQIILDYIDLVEDKILFRHNQLAHITSSGLILNNHMTKVLMAHHNIYNTWAWTGGHADGDKDLLMIAIKEAKEETGIKEVMPITEEIVSIDILPVYSHMKNGMDVNTHLHLNASYVLIADENEKLIVNKEENSDVMWIDVVDIDRYCNEPDMVEVYKKIIDRAKLLKSEA